MSGASPLKDFARYTSLNVLGMIALSCYILADTFFVSLGLGADGLAALNLAIPIYNFIHGSGLMIGMGGGTRYSILQSQGNRREANKVFTHVLYLAAVLAALLLPGMTLLRLVSVPVLGWLMLLVSPFQLGAQWRDLHRARRGVRQGGAYRFPGPRPGRRTLLRNICTWLLPLAAAYMLLAGGLLFPRQQSLPEGGTLPRIEELTGPSGAQPPEGRGDTLRRQLPTLLCPVQLTATQYAYDPPAGGGTVWTGQVLDMQYVHLAIPAMAGPVVRGWLSSRWGGDAWQVQEGDCPGTDLVLLVRSRDTGECPAAAITCGGRAVMYEAPDGIDLSGSLPLLARPVLEGRPIG